MLTTNKKKNNKTHKQIIWNIVKKEMLTLKPKAKIEFEFGRKRFVLRRTK